ncbi:MAG: thiamine-phosphate pyrophosphorylase [Candidatus Omnitrophota bacterium]|nr:MAG: thiamine-phosphate pyrophosphorylase [Candidatus Omnitrophota bacterium]
MKKGIVRVIDANYNRCKEGLRVAEDIFRFILQDDALRKRIRKLRHDLDEVAQSPVVKEGILHRDSRADLGRKIDHLEIKRENLSDLIYINIQRAKESLRVMEEFFKIILPSKVATMKKMRYEIYTLEKNILLKWPSLHHLRQKRRRKNTI